MTIYKIYTMFIKRVRVNIKMNAKEIRFKNFTLVKMDKKVTTEDLKQSFNPLTRDQSPTESNKR